MWSKFARSLSVALCGFIMLPLATLALDPADEPIVPPVSEEEPYEDQEESSEEISIEEPGSEEEAEEAALPEGKIYTPDEHHLLDDISVSVKLADEDSEHSRYIYGISDTEIGTDRALTRAEAAEMLYRLLENKPEDRAELSDVDAENWFYDSASLLAAAGIVEVYGESNEFRPEENITRGEFTAMISRLFDTDEAYNCDYEDVAEDHPYYADIAKVTELGYVNGVPGNQFCPDDEVNRAEAIVILNRILGRTPDKELLDTLVLLPYVDLAKSHWAYYDVLEATVDHTDAEGAGWTDADFSAFKKEPGFYFVEDFDYYYIGEDGFPVTDTTVGYLYFGADGKYTSGDSEIDGYVKEVLRSKTTEDMTQEQKLRAAYIYTRDSFSYLRRAAYSDGATGWEIEDARTMFSTKRGNCYCYTAVFLFLSRQLGYDSHAIAGRVPRRGGGTTPHAWVEMTFDGVNYLYDAELEMAYKNAYNLYHITYNKAPWHYTKP